jgi:phosphoribosylformimino-5-aminoimidazole carboxamide ribotide isomerase
MIEIIPAIDILDKKVVRLTLGDPDRSDTYMDNPLEAALNWQKQGANSIHIIDLDAVFGKSDNHDIIISISENLEIPIQIGGGIRTIAKARYFLDSGVEKIILGSMPIKNPEESKLILGEYGPDRVIIALDHEKGRVKIDGWKKSGGLTIIEALERFTADGFEWFLVTDITRDGTLKGPDIRTMNTISDKASIIASGGVSSLQDISDLRSSGVKAVVIGKALYEKKLSLAEILEEAKRC